MINLARLHVRPCRQCLQDYSDCKKTEVRHWRFEGNTLSFKYKLYGKQWTKPPCFSLSWVNHVWISWWSLWDDVHFSASILMGLTLHSTSRTQTAKMATEGFVAETLQVLSLMYWKCLLSITICSRVPLRTKHIRTICLLRAAEGRLYLNTVLHEKCGCFNIV